VSRAETLDKIKDAESKAKETVKAAEERSSAIVAAARKEAVRKVTAAEDVMKADFDAAIAKERSKIASQRSELLNQGKEEADRLKVRSANNIPKAKNHLKERFERTVDASS